MCHTPGWLLSDLGALAALVHRTVVNDHLVGGDLTILKHMCSPMGRLIPYMKWKLKHVPNHQPC